MGPAIGGPGVGTVVGGLAGAAIGGLIAWKLWKHYAENVNPSDAVPQSIPANPPDTAHTLVLRKYDIRNFSSRDFFQFIFVVKAAEYGNCRHVMVIRNVMPSGLKRDLRK